MRDWVSALSRQSLHCMHTCCKALHEYSDQKVKHPAPIYVCTNPFEECLYGEEQVPLSRVTAQIIKKKKKKKKKKKTCNYNTSYV